MSPSVMGFAPLYPSYGNLCQGVIVGWVERSETHD